MGQRQKGEYKTTLRDIPILSLWYSGNDSGYSFGIKHLNRNIHLTMYSRDDMINCHISDTGKEPHIIWKVEMSIHELMAIAKKAFKKIFRFYWWGSSYLQLSNNLQTIIESASKDNILMTEMDLDPFIRSICSDDFLTKKRIREGFHEGFRIGFIQKKEEWYIVVPFSKYRLFRMNIDLSKSPLAVLPPIQGLTRYLNYLDKEEIFEKSTYFNEEYRERIVNSIIGILSDVGFSNEP